MSIANMNNEPIEACNPPLGYPPLVLEVWNRWIIIMDAVTITLYLGAVIVLYVRSHTCDGMLLSELLHLLVEEHRVSEALHRAVPGPDPLEPQLL
uniref:E3 ubiquitin-protein ligase MARCH6 n=1 Tax=Steinernema glaseri TaxID=37863 RepID=A0A1I8AGQ4_9BILA